jgi:hypothetical protein
MGHSYLNPPVLMHTTNASVEAWGTRLGEFGPGSTSDSGAYAPAARASAPSAIR